jgi:hypothetical protein
MQFSVRRMSLTPAANDRKLKIWGAERNARVFPHLKPRLYGKASTALTGFTLVSETQQFGTVPARDSIIDCEGINPSVAFQTRKRAL